MTDNNPSWGAETQRYRQLAMANINKAQARYEIAVLDHVTARIRAGYPDTTHLTFEHFSRSREVELRAFWASEPDGTQRRVLDARLDMTSLDIVELNEDLTRALAGHHAAAWSAVRPDPTPDKRWILDLPPADRAARIAELVRAHHPNAKLITVDFASDPCRVESVTAADLSESGGTITEPVVAIDERPLWPRETERQIAALARQIYVLPHLQAQHLARVGGPRERTVFLLLPAATEV